MTIWCALRLIGYLSTAFPLSLSIGVVVERANLKRLHVCSENRAECGLVCIRSKNISIGEPAVEVQGMRPAGKSGHFGLSEIGWPSHGSAIRAHPWEYRGQGRRSQARFILCFKMVTNWQELCRYFSSDIQRGGFAGIRNPNAKVVGWLLWGEIHNADPRALISLEDLPSKLQLLSSDARVNRRRQKGEDRSYQQSDLNAKPFPLPFLIFSVTGCVLLYQLAWKLEFGSYRRRRMLVCGLICSLVLFAYCAFWVLAWVIGFDPSEQFDGLLQLSQNLLREVPGSVVHSPVTPLDLCLL
jgi:hypothetical protein